jgi:hypothetical protein
VEADLNIPEELTHTPVHVAIEVKKNTQ